MEGDRRSEIEAIETDNKELDIDKSLIEIRGGDVKKMSLFRMGENPQKTDSQGGRNLKMVNRVWKKVRTGTSCCKVLIFQCSVQRKQR